MKSKKIKNTFLAFISLALVAAASVAVTWALVDVGSEITKKVNTQKSGELNVALDEPWFTFTEHTGTENYTSDNLPPDYPDAVITSKKKGEDIASAYNANTLIPKNPTLWNTKANSKEFVAMGVRYTVVFGAQTYSDATGTTAVTGSALTFQDPDHGTSAQNRGKYVFDQIAELYKSNNTAGTCDDWTQDTASTGGGTAYPNLYYYNKALVNSGTDVSTGNPLFQYVKIKGLTTNTNGLYAIQVNSNTTYYTKTLPQFKISLKGYAVDANSFVDNPSATSTQTTGTSGSQSALEALYAADTITVS